MVYARITLPLQIFASATAETVLNWIGIPVLRDGNILELPHQRLSVVEACSGIRSLLSLAFLSLVYAYFFDQRVGMRWVLLAATVPIAIAANAARITLMGLVGIVGREARFICSKAGCCLWWRSACWSRFIRYADADRTTLILSALLVVQGAAFYGLSRRAEWIPLSKPLADFRPSSAIGGWCGKASLNRKRKMCCAPTII